MNRRLRARVPLYAVVAALALPVSALLAADDVYTRQDTWPATLRLSLEKLDGVTRAGLPAGGTAGPEGTALGPWYLTGPFAADPKAGFETRFPPLQGVDLAKPCGGKPWTAKPGLVDGVVHELKAPGQAATFLYRTIAAPKAATIKGYYGSDDGLAVWLNGQRLLANPANRGMGPNQDQADLALRTGENQLLLMIYNNQGGHGFYFSTNATPGSARQGAVNGIWNRLVADFPAADAQREITWEREDGVWDEPWTPGDLAALARRYADRCAIAEFAEKARALAPSCKTEADLQAVRALYNTSKWCEKTEAVRRDIGVSSVRLAVQDLARRFPNEYRGKESLARLDAFGAEAERLCTAAAGRDPAALKALPELRSRWDALRRELLLANPAIDFEKVLFVRRKGSEGLTQNWQGNDALHGRGFDNEIATFRIRQPEAPVETVYRPAEPIFVGDVDLHFDGDRMLFSTNGTVCEVRTDGSGFRKVVTEVAGYEIGRAHV